jgi:hypothetical protein
MASKQDDVNIKASVSTNFPGETIQVGPHNFDDNTHAGASGAPDSLFVELMRHVALFSSSFPESTLSFIARLDEMYACGPRDDRSFLERILPLVSGAIF